MNGRAAMLMLAAAAALSAGCYRYAPADLDALRPGAGVRARLAADEAERLQRLRGTDSAVLEGTVVSDDGYSVTVLVPVAARAQGGAVETLHERLRVARARIETLEVRRLDRLRTFGLAAGGALAALGILLLQLGES